jgi:hypothetical protein
MSEKQRMLAEVRRLIDEQMEALRGNLEPTEAVRYADRKRRIAELLERVSRLDS